MLSCMRYRNRLGAYLDGELNLRQSNAVSLHVAKCKACRAAVEDLRRLAPVMHVVEVPPVPADLADHVMALALTRVASLQGPPVTRSPWERWRIVPVPMRFAACATVLLAFALGLTMGRGIFLSGNGQVAAAGAASVEGFEWFSQTPPASLASTYMTLASNNMGGMAR